MKHDKNELKYSWSVFIAIRVSRILNDHELSLNFEECPLYFKSVKKVKNLIFKSRVSTFPYRIGELGSVRKIVWKSCDFISIVGQMSSSARKFCIKSNASSI